MFELKDLGRHEEEEVVEEEEEEEEEVVVVTGSGANDSTAGQKKFLSLTLSLSLLLFLWTLFQTIPHFFISGMFYQVLSEL